MRIWPRGCACQKAAVCLLLCRRMCRIWREIGSGSFLMEAHVQNITRARILNLCRWGATITARRSWVEMAYGEITLVPGVDVERTPTVQGAGYNQSQFIRFKAGLAQKLGGWQKYYPFAVAGVPRELHAWEDLNGTNHLGVGTTTQLGVITSGSFKDITPQ